MSHPCSFCGAPLPDAPPGAAVRCPACSNLASTPGLPRTITSLPAPPPGSLSPTPFGAAPSSGLPFSSVDQPKPAASPPPAVNMPSRAGGVDELVGGGLTILGISAIKLALFVGLGIFFSCFSGIVLSFLR